MDEALKYQQIGKYPVKRKLGEGACSEVFLCHDPFRDAHETVARAVRAAEGAGCDLAALPLKTLRRFSNAIGRDIYPMLTLEGSIAARDHIGGTAPARVRAAVSLARKKLR